MGTSRVGGELHASVNMCVCVCTCVFTYGRGWCGKYREEEEGLSFSDFQILPKCSLHGGLQRCLPAPHPAPVAAHWFFSSSSSDCQDRRPPLPQGFGVAWQALVSFPKSGVIADDAHVEQCQNQLYFT